MLVLTYLIYMALSQINEKNNVHYFFVLYLQTGLNKLNDFGIFIQYLHLSKCNQHIRSSNPKSRPPRQNTQVASKNTPKSLPLPVKPQPETITPSQPHRSTLDRTAKTAKTLVWAALEATAAVFLTDCLQPNKDQPAIRGRLPFQVDSPVPA